MVLTGSAAGAALLAAACGGSSGSGGSKTPAAATGFVSQPVDETSSAKRGGILPLALTADVITFDPHTTSLPNQTATTLAYSQLFRVVDGHLEPSGGQIEGDVVESWEFSPDRLSLTLKLSRNAHWAPLPPANGRVIDAQDVIFTWQRFKQSASRRSDIVNEVNPDAPVVSMTATDDRTVMMKLAAPNATIQGLFAQVVAGSFYVVPKEAADQNALDLRRTQLGTGPWYLGEYTPSVRLHFRRNPGFQQDKRNLPYIDELDYPIVPEYASILAQFRAHAIYTYAFQAEDLLPAKNDIPELLLLPTDLASAGTRNFFGVDDPESPFKDVRVRQAWFMSQDRDLFIDVIYSVSKFRSQGLPIDTAWDTALPASTYKGWWTDPKGKDFGPNARYYQHDVAAAKQMLAAAGYKDGLEVSVVYPASGYSPAFYKHVETTLSMVGDAGFKAKLNTVNFGNEWNNYRVVKGKFDGTAFITDSGGAEPANFLYAHYNSGGSLFQGGDDKMDDLTSKMRQEFDEGKRKGLAIELQKYEAQQLFYPRLAGGATGFMICWPALRNEQVWRGGTGRTNATLFLDPTKAPLSG